MKMPCQQLPADCLNEIFEYLENDKVTLHSCLLVNHLWCEVSVRILWRHRDNCEVSTLIACLPDESKDLLRKNGMYISTPVSKPPSFNYPSFCKVLSVYQIARNLVDQQIFNSSNLNINDDNKDLTIQEIFKMLMNQTSLKKLNYSTKNISDFSYSWYRMINIPNFAQFPGAKDCLTGLSKFSCSSNLHSEFCHQLSQICHNIQSINIEFVNVMSVMSSGLKHLIASQNSLKSLSLISPNPSNVEIVPLLMGCSNTLIKLKITLAFKLDFNGLKSITFPQLQILKLHDNSLETENFIKFLETNGKNLKEFYVISYEYNSINLAIAKFCPNLKSLCTTFFNDEDGLETLKIIFHSCEQLEKIKVRCSGRRLLKEQQIFEIIANHSPKNFHELELDSDDPKPGWYSIILESFFISWKNRIPQNPLSFIVLKNSYSLDKYDKHMPIIEKYKKLGTIREFRAKYRKSIW